MTELCDLANKYKTDKGPICWNYTQRYFDLWNERRHLVQKVLEVGVLEGASLRMWRDFFPNAQIWGIDIDPKCQVEGEDRITTICADAYTKDGISQILTKAGPGFHFIVDDAMHFAIPQLMLLAMLWETLAPAGIYAIEEARLEEPLTLIRPHRMEVVQTIQSPSYNLVLMCNLRAA